MIRDDFAGPGGWEQGLRLLGYDGPVVGVENDADAVATARAAGHARVLADVRRVGVRNFDRYVASPPCQTFAQSGDGSGLRAFAHLKEAANRVAYGADPAAAVAAVADRRLDERSVLVLEPLRVAVAARPAWLALEQVPTVLPLWQHFAALLETLGYSAKAGHLHAEQYGVPQTRKRAILVATLTGEAPWPTPTHSRYHPRDPQRLDPDVKPWVSMLEALGCEPEAAVPGDTSWVARRPSPTIVGSFRPDIVAAPGYRRAGDPPRQGTPGSVRVTLEQAGVLQSFPADYPWQGRIGSQYRQVGNAIPPMLAAAILEPLLERE